MSLTLQDVVGHARQYIRLGLMVTGDVATHAKEGDGLAAFLGSSIVDKVTFHDGKHSSSKTDYAESEPKSALEMSASLFSFSLPSGIHCV
ncbi:hypothetical protein BGW80DRAFT_1319071 [Lactifluus volemus]|nr:hypothetical protein BGW80DRAFT_1319071 [Lactifluus volemus]